MIATEQSGRYYDTPARGHDTRAEGANTMNKARRSRIADVQTQLEALKQDIDDILAEEQEAYDNMPESLQNSERGEAMQEAIDALESAVGSCEELDEYLTNATEH